MGEVSIQMPGGCRLKYATSTNIRPRSRSSPASCNRGCRQASLEDISAVPTPFTPACDGHPLAPIAGPIVVRGAKPGDVVAIDLIELTPFGSGKSAILRDFGVLRRE